MLELTSKPIKNESNRTGEISYLTPVGVCPRVCHRQYSWGIVFHCEVLVIELSTVDRLRPSSVAVHKITA